MWKKGRAFWGRKVCEAKEFYVAYKASAKEGVITEVDIGGINFFPYEHLLSSNPDFQSSLDSRDKCHFFLSGVKYNDTEWMELRIVKSILKGGQTHVEDLRGRSLGSLLREGRRKERTEVVVETEDMHACSYPWKTVPQQKKIGNFREKGSLRQLDLTRYHNFTINDILPLLPIIKHLDILNFPSSYWARILVITNYSGKGQVESFQNPKPSSPMIVNTLCRRHRLICI